MSEKGSVFQKGGGGTNFEQYVQSAFVTNLIIKGNAPCIPSNEIKEVALQVTRRGWETDDLMVIAESAVGKHQLLMQCKHTLTFSEKDDTFREVIAAFWKDFNKPGFNKVNDRLIFVKQRLNNLEKNHIKGVLNFAKTHHNYIDFLREVKRIKEKNDRLELFAAVLKEANNDVSVGHQTIWEFLKVLDVLGYDFGDQGSVDETYLLNLIKLAKSSHATATDREIWASVIDLVTRLNPNGGSITYDSLAHDSLMSYFDITKIDPFTKAIQKLNSDSAVILKPFKNVIGESEQALHLDRTALLDDIGMAVAACPITVITGKPGVGKSAAMKEALAQHFTPPSLFVFRADQFNQPHLSTLFANQGINGSLHDIFSCLTLLPEKIIVVDSLEKLLEDTDPGNAFKQFLELLKDYPDLKLICTSRKYAIDLLIQKFGIDQKDIKMITVEPLSDEELQAAGQHFPRLQRIVGNSRIKSLLQSPKYLDFALRSLDRDQTDLSGVSVLKFKEILWNALVKNSGNRVNGLPAKREDAFLEIAVDRAKEMKLFIKPKTGDEEAIDLLESDEMIFQDQLNRRYAPAHDILEDWALIKYVSAKYDDHGVPALFTQLGNEPAIRRAFRLWVEDHLIDDTQKVIALIEASINDPSIANYWADEILIAVFRSEDCQAFFTAFGTRLTENKATFLNRCIHILRTACKEKLITSSTTDILVPTGSGWTAMARFIAEHIDTLGNIRLTIINMLLDWHLKSISSNRADKAEKENVKLILLHYLAEIEHGDSFWTEAVVKNRQEEIIQLLFDLADVAATECDSLIQRAMNGQKGRRNRRSKAFYDLVINNCLSGTSHFALIKALPDRMIEVMWKAWKVEIPEPNPNEDPLLRSLRRHRLSNDEAWGITDHLEFMPAGIFKTPMFWLLQAHPLKGLQFITGFLNYAVDFYRNADVEYAHELNEIELELTDGTKIRQWAAWELWAAYRGLTVTHYCIESLLMSLEKYMLQTADRKNDVSRANTRFMFDYLLRHSNNVAVTSVLASVTMAYPEEVGEAMLPLLGVREFYSWDISRTTQEGSAMSPADDQISYAQQERHEFNQLPHRRQFYNGLQGFLVDYQFHIGTINEQIFQVFDRLKENVAPDDIVWKKNLMEMDRRNWRADFKDENKDTIIIQPAYDEEVTEFIGSGKDYIDHQMLALRYAGQIDKTLKNEADLNYAGWLVIFNHYQQPEQGNGHFDKPASLAVLGLEHFTADLDDAQRQWCVETLIAVIMEILHTTFKPRYDLVNTYNIMEKKTALQSFHLFMDLLVPDDQAELAATIICILFAPFAEHEVRYITEYFRDVFFKKFPQFTERFWSGLIKYAAFKKQHPRRYYDQGEEEKNAYDQLEQDLILELATIDDFSLDIDDINFDNHAAYLLVRALMITPYELTTGQYGEYVQKLIPLVLDDLELELNYGFNREKDERQLSYEHETDVKTYLAERCLHASFEQAKAVVDLLTPLVLAETQPSVHYRRHDPQEFVSKLVENLIYKLDNLIANTTDEEYKHSLITNFWKVWQYLYAFIKAAGGHSLTKVLLFDIDWKQDSKSWLPFEGKRSVYHDMVTQLGQGYALSLIRVLSTAGEAEFLPEGLNWLAKLLKANTQEQLTLASSPAERLIKRLYLNHIMAIKRTPGLIDDLLYLLNKMIDLGSSAAYFYRENVITYKVMN